MKTSKIFFASVLSFLLMSATFFNAVAADNPKKDSLKNDEKQRKEKVAYSQEEVSFIAEMDAYYAKKYGNPMNLVQHKIEKIIVSNVAGTIIQELDSTSQEKIATGAEKLMVKGNTAYYIAF